MAVPVVLLDACVLYSAPLRDLLMYLAEAELYQPKWTDAIHDEWIEAILRSRPDLDRQRLDRTRYLMNLHIDDAMVTNYEYRIEGLKLPDEKDRHVLAAAIESGASIILTFNLEDFPNQILATNQLTAMHPDAFLSQLLFDSAHEFLNSMRMHHQSLQKPAIALENYLSSLKVVGLQETIRTIENSYHTHLG